MAFNRLLAASIMIIALTTAVYGAPDPDWHINFGVSINDSAVITHLLGQRRAQVIGSDLKTHRRRTDWLRSSATKPRTHSLIR